MSASNSPSVCASLKASALEGDLACTQRKGPMKLKQLNAARILLHVPALLSWLARHPNMLLFMVEDSRSGGSKPQARLSAIVLSRLRRPIVEARKLEHAHPPTPNQRKEDNPYKSSSIHVPTVGSLLEVFSWIQQAEVGILRTQLHRNCKPLRTGCGLHFIAKFACKHFLSAQEHPPVDTTSVQIVGFSLMLLSLCI